MYYMRVAQMYLIKAEAMARTNASIKDCLDVLNVLRLRSGNTTFEAADYSSCQTCWKKCSGECGNRDETGLYSISP